MRKLTKEELIDLALNMVRHINSVIDDEFLELEPSSLYFSYKTKSYKVKFGVFERSEEDDEEEEEEEV